MFSAVKHSIFTFLQSGFESKTIEYIFWWGFPVFFILGLRIEKRFKPLPKLLDVSLALALTAWMILYIFRVVGIFWKSLYGTDAIGLETIYEVKYVAWAIFQAQKFYNFLDYYLYPATSFILLTAPLFLLSVTSEGKIPTKIGKMVFNLYMSISILALGVIAISTIIENPVSAILFFGLVPVLSLFDFATAVTLRKKYSTDIFFRGFTIAKDVAAGDESTHRVRSLTLLVVIGAFWFNLTIPENVLIGFYTSVIGGLLAVVGFAALVFTFTHERLPSPGMGRQIGSDIRSAQKASGVTLICAVLGLLLVDGSLQLAVRALSIADTLRATALTISVISFVYAIDSVLILFRHVVDIVVGVDTRDTDFTFVFEESHTSDQLSASGSAPNSHSQMRDYIEEQNGRTLIVKNAT